MITDTEIEISAIENELAKLPQGSVVKKTVKGKDYYYRRIRSENKYVEIAIEPDSLASTKDGVARRKQLEKRLKELMATEFQSGGAKYRATPSSHPEATIYTGESLSTLVADVASFEKRECIDKIKDYVYGNSYARVLVLFGLRRTGKTTLMLQTIADMDSEHFDKTAYVKIPYKDYYMSYLFHELENLRVQGYKYIFIDEVTFMDDFIYEAGTLSDIYACCRMKIVLSGTHSLGFRLAAHDSLYDRCFFVRTTFIPYREFERVIGIKGVDKYISYGGTMSPSGTHYNEDFTPSAKGLPDSYQNIAIAENIQHSLKNNGGMGLFKSLEPLYNKGELTSAINRVVEDINHEFTVKILTRDFKSHDLSSSAQELREENDILDRVDKDFVTNNVKELLNILNRTEQTVKISETEAKDIENYLGRLDLVFKIDFLEWPSWKAEKYVTVLAQPGLRYAQAEVLVESLLEDQAFQNLDNEESDAILNRVRNDIRGRMMEEMVLLETYMANLNTGNKVFKLAVGKSEIDMVVKKEIDGHHTCSLYEVKHSDKRVPAQYKHLKNEDVCEKIEYRYGNIDGKYVIYRGETVDEGDIHYINVEEYLKSL